MNYSVIGRAKMAKKRLTDLLREEMQKSPELEGEEVTGITAVEESQMNTPSKPSTRNASPTKAELEATVAELRAALKNAEKAAQDKEEFFSDLENALKESHAKERSLQQQISELQSELQHQKETGEKLKKNLEKIDQLKIEFEKAKTAALQLAQVNEKLTKEIDTLKKEKEDLKAQGRKVPTQQPGRPIQTESDKPVDFATKSWLL